MRFFKFYWSNGYMSAGWGESADDAFACLGHRLGSWKSLDYWEEIE